MHILLVADGRSPITKRWIQTLLAIDHQVTLVSTYPCQPLEGITDLVILPVAFASSSGSQVGKRRDGKKNLIARFRPFFQTVRYRLGPLTLAGKKSVFVRLVRKVSPDVVHALRIPYEGMLACFTPEDIPLILSTWGNDLTLHAAATARMSTLTRQALQRADGLLADCWRDIRLAQSWGFDPAKPHLVVPGNGGLSLSEVDSLAVRIQKEQPIQIINPRGMRSYVRNDTFFQSIPLVLERHPEVKFICPSMAGQPEAEAWVDHLHLQRSVQLLPYLNQDELWQEFARSSISVSVTSHDGTPNTLLEAMAFGCLPVCGDIESIREWVTPGINGLLADPTDASALAEMLCLAIENEPLREKAAAANRSLLEERTKVEGVRNTLAAFYQQWCASAEG